MKNVPMLSRRLAAGSAATLCTLLLAAAVQAAPQAAPPAPEVSQPAPKMMSQDKMSQGKMSHKRMHGKTVYACTECKMYYTPAQAKAMKYMDPMGHSLTKMTKAPAGFTAAGKMDNMGKMDSKPMDTKMEKTDSKM